MFLRSIAELNFSSITLEASRNEGDREKNLAIINATFVQASSNLSEANSELANLHLRVIASYTPSSSQLGDFTCQRFNEYNLFDSQSAEFGNDNPPEEMVDFLQNEIAQKAGVSFLKQAGPFSPFSTDRSIIPRMFRDRVSSAGTPSGITLYDDLLVNLMPRSANVVPGMSGGPLSERGISSTRVRTTNPIRSTQTSLSQEEIESGVFTGTEETGDQDQPPVDNSLQLLDRVSLLPIIIDLSSVSSLIKDNLTFYMFVYDSNFAPQEELFELPEISLNTGMSQCISATVRGNRTVWKPISISRPYLGLGKRLPGGEYLDATSATAPNANIFQHIDLSPSDNVVIRLASVFDRVYDQLARTILDEKPEIRKIISKDNYLSELWISKDSDENHRFSFAFDLESYLIANSYFPFLYRSQNLSRQIINQTGFMAGSEPSKTLSMRVLRRFVSEDSTMPVNQLTTSGHLVEKGPNIPFPEKVIDSVGEIPNLYLDQPNDGSTPNKIIFYEGKDSFDIEGKYTFRDAQISGDFIYGADFTVYDAAPIFMRNLVTYLMQLRSGVEEVFNTIVNSVPTTEGYQGGVVKDGRNLYNPETLALNVPLRQIVGAINGQQVNFYDYLIETIQQYQVVINDLAPLTTGGLLDEFYSAAFSLNRGLIDPLTIKDVQKLIDLGIQMLFRKLTEIFPNDPLGRGLDISETSPLERRGFCQRKFPVLRGRHFFGETYKKGKNLGYGYDFIFTKEPDMGQRSGITRISFPEYETRVNQEFVKYFQSPEDPDEIRTALLPQGPYRNPGYAYFTSKTIRTPMTDDILQTTAGAAPGTPISNYDLDRYGRLFCDIVDLNHRIHNRQHNPTITPGRRLRASANEELFNSVIKVLEEQYAVEIKTEDILPQYNPPRVSTGKYEPTVKDKEKVGTLIIQNGPLAIPTLVGGANNIDPTTLTYFSNVETGLSNTALDKQKGYTDEKISTKRKNQIPIKLPFAIFGELSVDSSIDLDTTYQEKEFNSMTGLTNILATRGAGFAQTVETGVISSFPNQLKNMILLTSTNEDVTLGTYPVQFSPCRPYLEDKDSAILEQLVSYYNSDDPPPPFPQTKDPMKVYAKFLAFWMNYKQIARIEYLDTFSSLDAASIFYSDIPQSGNPEVLDNTYLRKTKMPVWKVMDPDFAQDVVKSGKILFCRVRVMSPLDYRDLVSSYKQPIIDVFTESFRNKEPLELPMYNKYFLLGTPQQEPEPEPEQEPKPKDEPGAFLGGLVGY